MRSPVEVIQSLRIGTVEFVSPSQIKVALDTNAPETVALNAGAPRPFPRVNSYVLIPFEEGFMVGQVEWLTVERYPFPPRAGMQDSSLVDLPYPVRKMSINPLGTLSVVSNIEVPTEIYQFRRGVNLFPSVGDGVLLPTSNQLRSIIESGEKRRVKIGTSPLAGNAEVKVDPDKLFGRHLAILGNTGSGKSCSVAGLIRWSIEEAQKETETPNARFVILDPNGEYARAFASDSKILSRVYRVGRTNERALSVPFWFWNTAEWCSFTQASVKTQQPTLVHALRTVKAGFISRGTNESREMRCFIRTIVATLYVEKRTGTPWGIYPKPKSFKEKLAKWSLGLSSSDQFSDEANTALSEMRDYFMELVDARSAQYSHDDFTRPEVENLISKAEDAYAIFGGSETDFQPINSDLPIEFDGDSFFRSIEASAEMLNVTDYVDTMLMRVRTLLSDARMQQIFDSRTMISLEQWLTEYIGSEDSKTGNIAIIDLSLVPSEVIHIITAVIARMIFEALQRYCKLHPNNEVLPTTLVIDEAHTFVKRYTENDESHNASSVCCRVFERIAREGRKFGLGLMLSSQRPSELSPTVLSQCNTFLIHRISNDKDQDLVHRFVPDNLRGLLSELPSLPSQNAILLGWASELPVLVRMSDLMPEHRPQSEDPDFWSVWTRKSPREINWGVIAAEWQGSGRPESAVETEGNSEDENTDEGQTGE